MRLTSLIALSIPLLALSGCCVSTHSAANDAPSLQTHVNTELGKARSETRIWELCATIAASNLTESARYAERLYPLEVQEYADFIFCPARTAAARHKYGMTDQTNFIALADAWRTANEAESNTKPFSFSCVPTLTDTITAKLIAAAVYQLDADGITDAECERMVNVIDDLRRQRIEQYVIFTQLRVRAVACAKYREEAR